MRASKPRGAVAILSLGACSPDSLEGVAPEQIARVAERRASFGLLADQHTVASLLASGRDAGSEHWGIPMTEAEQAELDLLGRMAFAHAVKESVVPFINSLPTSGGVYIDQQQNGSLVVLLTEPAAELEAEIAKRMPAVSRGFHVAKATYTEAQLWGALTRAWDVWKEVTPYIQLRGAGLDIMGNRVVFHVDPADLGRPPCPRGARGLQRQRHRVRKDGTSDGLLMGSEQRTLYGSGSQDIMRMFAVLCKAETGLDITGKAY